MSMRLYRHLCKEFGRDRVIQQSDSAWAVPDPKSTAKPAAGDSALLVMIGPAWSTARNTSGQSSLDDPQDPVRTRIEAALHDNIPLFPVLVADARLPETVNLPVSLRPLILQPPARLSAEHFDNDALTLTDRLRDAADLADDTIIAAALPGPAAATAPPAIATATEEIRSPTETVPALSPAWRPHQVPLPPAETGQEPPPNSDEAPPGESAKPAPHKPDQPTPDKRVRRATLIRTSLTALFSLASITIAIVAIVNHFSNHTTSPPHSRPSTSLTTPVTPTTSPQVTPTGCPPSQPPSNRTPAQVLQTYYADINNRSFCAAWNLGGSLITPGQTYNGYVAGFNSTVKDVLTIISVTGSSPATVNVSLQTFNKNAQPITFTGYYNVENGKITYGHLE